MSKTHILLNICIILFLAQPLAAHVTPSSYIKWLNAFYAAKSFTDALHNFILLEGAFNYDKNDEKYIRELSMQLIPENNVSLLGPKPRNNLFNQGNEPFNQNDLTSLRTSFLIGKFHYTKTIQELQKAFKSDDLKTAQALIEKLRHYYAIDKKDPAFGQIQHYIYAQGLLTDEEGDIGKFVANSITKLENARKQQAEFKGKERVTHWKGKPIPQVKK